MAIPPAVLRMLYVQFLMAFAVILGGRYGLRPWTVAVLIVVIVAFAVTVAGPFESWR
jgi:hypothetical protein